MQSNPNEQSQGLLLAQEGVSLGYASQLKKKKKGEKNNESQLLFYADFNRTVATH